MTDFGWREPVGGIDLSGKDDYGHPLIENIIETMEEGGVEQEVIDEVVDIVNDIVNGYESKIDKLTLDSIRIS